MNRTKRIKLIAMMVALVLAFVGAAQGEEAIAIYKARCVGCHGENGVPDETVGKALKLRSLGSAEVQEQTDRELASVIANGRERMAGYSDKLSKDEVVSLVKYIRTMKK